MKKIISVILLSCMLLTMIPAAVLSAFAETPEEINVTWNSGYVGAATNGNFKNSVSGASDGWKYTDIITIPKAGTRISFSMTGVYPTNSVWLFSEWKQSGSNWVMDLGGANVVGMASYEFIGQKKNGTTAMDYEFISDHDNQSIRICLKYTEAAGLPKVYSSASTAKSTLQQLKDLEFTAKLTDDGKVTGLNWFCGYASSAVNTNGSAKEWKYFSSGYAFTNFFTVPKAGTKLSYTLTCSSNNAYNAFTRYKLVDGIYVYDIGFDANNDIVRTGSGPYTYTYVTEKDNEVLRICCRPGTDYKTVAVSEPVSVSWVATNEAGTATKQNKTEWPDPELLSLVTGAGLIGTEVKLNWIKGYIGSQYHDSAKLVYTSPSNVDYYTSDVFTVPKAGTTVYFFDQTFTDYDGGNYATTSAITVSHWSDGKLDKTKPYLTGCDAYSLLLTENYRCYAYTTTEDNESLRLCLRYAPKYTGEAAVIPPVYLVLPTDFDVEQPAAEETAGKKLCNLFDGSYTDASGVKVEYKYYLPYGSAIPDKQYSLVFDNSADGAVAKYFAEKGSAKSIVIWYNGNIETALRLLDEVVEHYPVKVSDIQFVGGDELAAHAKRFENIRLCEAMIYTGTKAVPTLEYGKIKALSSFASTDAAAAWLIGEYDDYYDVLDGIKMYAIGDSYFGGSGLGQHQTWVNLLGYKYGMTFHNYGIGGNQVAVIPNNTEGNQPSMCTRYDELPAGGDIYFVEGGRNDRHHSVPFGTNDSKVNTTFKGALNIIINALRAKNPNALIVLVTPWSSTGESGYLGTNNKYADAMKELADYINDKHVVCLYAADVEFTGIDMSVAATRAKYCLTANDYSHLNANGMYMVEPIFEKWIAGKYAELNDLTITNDNSGTGDFQTIETEGSEEEPKTDSKPSDSETAKTDVPTTEAPKTDAPDTTPAKKNNCGGVSAVAQAAALMCGIFGFAIIRKRK